MKRMRPWEGFSMTRAEIVRKLTEGYTAAYNRYRNAVLRGERPASKVEKAKVKRQERDLKEGVPGFRFDIDAGLRPLLWIAINLAFPKGGKRGKPMMLADWQAWDTIVLFGWIKKDDPKTRRFTDAFFEVARKNGKSTYVGALLDYLAFGEVDGVSCYIGATSLDQAGETFRRAADALKLRKGDNVLVSDSKNNKQIKYKSSEITAIAAEPKDGKLSYAAVIDEYHQHKDNTLLNSIASGNISEQQAMLIRITTAGVSLGGVCHEEYKKCKRVLSGELEIPRYFISIYELDEGDSADDPKNWPKANPNWGVSVNAETFESHYEYARASEDDMIDFKTKNLNMWCHSLHRWANMPLWMERCRWHVDEESLVGKMAYGGLDLSSVSDFTAFTLDFPLEDERHVQITHCWIPESMVIPISRQCRIPLRKWIDAGWVTATPGDVIDYAYVVDYLTWAYSTFQIHYIAADRWRIEELVRLMPPWFQDVAYEFSQGMKTMSPTIMDFERTYLEGKVSDNGNECVDWMMSCAETFQDSSGNVKLVKPKKRTEARIDGVITSVMALSNAKTNDMSAFSGSVEDMLTAW